MTTFRRYRRRDLRKIFSETDYGIDQLIASGVLDEGIRDTPTAHPYWTPEHLKRAEQRLYERSLPNRPVKGKGVTLSPRHAARLRAA